MLQHCSHLLRRSGLQGQVNLLRCRNDRTDLYAEH